MMGCLNDYHFWDENLVELLSDTRGEDNSYVEIVQFLKDLSTKIGVRYVLKKKEKKAKQKGATKLGAKVSSNQAKEIKDY